MNLEIINGLSGLLALVALTLLTVAAAQRIDTMTGPRLWAYALGSTALILDITGRVLA